MAPKVGFGFYSYKLIWDWYTDSRSWIAEAEKSGQKGVNWMKTSISINADFSALENTQRRHTLGKLVSPPPLTHRRRQKSDIICKQNSLILIWLISSKFCQSRQPNSPLKLSHSSQLGLSMSETFPSFALFDMYSLEIDKKKEAL